MIPILFKLGPITINSFGVMAMFAFLIPTVLLRKEVARIGLDPDLANGIAIAAMIGGFLGARLYYIFERWDRFLADPTSYLFTGAGLVWYGGLFGGTIAVLWYLKRQKVSVPLVVDLTAPLLALGQVFGRCGCLLSGDGDYGHATEVPWAMSFPEGIVPTNELVHPTPIYDMAILFAIFLLLWSLRTRQMPAGSKLSLYFILIGIGRIVTEIWRTTPDVLWGLTAAQLISMALIVTGSGLIVYLHADKGRANARP